MPRSTTDDVLKFAWAHGCEGRLSLSAFVTWKLRLDVESGRQRPYQVDADPLPEDVNPTVRSSYEGFVTCSNVAGFTHRSSPHRGRIRSPHAGPASRRGRRRTHAESSST
jgi:hypothetical protein